MPEQPLESPDLEPAAADDLLPTVPVVGLAEITTDVTAAATATTAGGAVTPVAAAYRKRTLGLIFWLSVSWLVVVVLAALLADLLPLADYTDTTAGVARSGPSGDHVLGVDGVGRDMLARVVYGTRVSLAVGFMSILMGLVVGGGLGVVAGYFRGRIESVIMGAMDILLAFPALVLALAIVTFWAQGKANIGHVTVAIGLLSIAPIARIIRANTLTFAQRDFVLAARALGAGDRRIIVKEILPNVLPPVFAFSLIAVAVAIVAEGTLAFLALSVQPPTPTWGGMINEGRRLLNDAPHVAFMPAIAMFLTVLALNFAGDSLRARFEVREGRL